MNMTGCFILVPLRGKITLGPRPQNKILLPFRGRFQKLRQACLSLLYGSTPAGGGGGRKGGLKAKILEV